MIFKAEKFYIAPCMLKDKVPDKVLEFSTESSKYTSRLCFSTTAKMIPVQVFHSLIAECISKWPVYRCKGKMQMFCGCSIFDVGTNHLLYICFTDGSLQIWIRKLSTNESEPDTKLCIEIKLFVQHHLIKTLQDSHELELYVKCPKASPKPSGHWWKVDEMNEEIRCDEHDPPFMLSKSFLMKYWDSLCLGKKLFSI